ncbi:uncharacterized protein LOC122075669 [Macadamia integrifolia]|uniref:uncharacterized protein LOC122075669 n=1 Tax=Macadamia integrifolia TaxID=60698 RepID=UPI001C4FAB73|nr:uncharacterized protein LOC122075669 [Macadamia integrifolia]
MEEAEKMVALKKAYAEIILNTAKEAAARIMVSERKTHRFQQELSTAKEEGLNMLLRMKQIMDSKIAEAEIASLSQQRKIEELEMQLHEAEEIVRDLRSELKGVQDELGRLKSNPRNILDGKIVMGNATPHEEEAQEDKRHISDGISCHSPGSGCRPMSTCIMKSALLNKSYDKCCSLSENGTAPVETSSNSPIENYGAGNPDLACIIMQGKETELYRNGCTQRIRAFEGNLLDGGKLPLPGHDDDQCLHSKNGERVEGTCTVDSPKTGNATVAETNMIESEEVMQHDSNCDKGQAGNVIRRFSNRRRRTRYRNLKATSCRSLADPCEPPFHSHTETYPFPVNGDAESGEDPSKVSEDEALRDSESHVESQARVDTKAGSPQNVTSKDSALINESVLTSQEFKAVESSAFLGSKLNLDLVDLPSIHSDAKDTKICETTTATPAEAANDRLLKYTFQRKRKKEIVSNANDDAPLEKKNTIKRTVENQNSTPEPRKSSLIIESSRDSRRLVQVARQLISLSEKRWR